MSRFERVRRAVTIILAAAAAFGFLWYANREGAKVRAEREAREAAQAEAELVAPEALIKLLDEGAGLMGRFEFAAAHGAFSRACIEFPDSRDASLNQAIALLNQTSPGAQEQALTSLEKIISADPEEARARYCAAMALLYLGQHGAALEQLERVALQHPSDAHVAFFTGQALELADQPERAAAQYGRARELDPWLRSAVLGQQRCASQLGDEAKSDELVQLFDRLAQDPRSQLAEFKYTRMGSLARVAMPSAPIPVRTLAGPPFALTERFPAEFAVDLPWSRAVGIASTTAADFNGDGVLDVFIARALERGSRNAVLAGTRAGSFELDQAHPLAGIDGVQCALWGDIDNDGLMDVFLGREGADSLMRQSPPGSWTDVAALAGVQGPESLNDDLSAGELAKPEEWLQSARLMMPEELDRAGQTVDGALADIDHDGDLDLLAIYHLAKPRMFMNLGNGSFQALDESSGFQPARALRIVNLGGSGSQTLRVFEDAATGCALADVDGDRDLDVFIFRGEYTEVWVNDLLWKWRRDPRHAPIEVLSLQTLLPLGPPLDGAQRYVALLRMPAARDANPPVWAVVIEADAKSTREVWRKQAAGSAQLAVCDVDGSGEASVLIGGTRRPIEVIDAKTGATRQEIVPDGMAARFAPIVRGMKGPELVVLSGLDCKPQLVPVGDRGNFVTASFSGRTDPSQSMRSNGSGIGTSVMARVGSAWVDGNTLRACNGPGQSLQPIALGIGAATRIEFLNIDWSDGVTQTELGLEAGVHHTVVETQRQLSSCPLVFAFDGDNYAFVTDCLGVGGIGYLATVATTPSGLEPVYAPPRPWERVLIPAGVLTPHNGMFEIRLCEPMEEALYLDSAQLLAYDLPSGWSLALDERMGISDPQPTGRAIAYRNLMLPSGATNGSGTSVLKELTKVDGLPVSSPATDPRFIGRLMSPLILEFTFAQAIADANTTSSPAASTPPSEGPVLLIDGWVEYPYGQTNFAMWQARALPRPFSLEALNPATNEWQMIAPDWGYPAGMTRQCALKLPSIPEGCRALRLSTEQEIYVDRIAIVQEEMLAVEPIAMEVSKCSVASCGYPQRIPALHKRAQFDYSRRDPLWDCRTQPGWYTDLGDCTPLVGQIDDAVAVIGPGEEIQLQFQGVLPPLEAGKTRTFVLEVNGWCKDMDLFTGTGATLAPPPARAGAPSAAAESLMSQFNTRYAGGR